MSDRAAVSSSGVPLSPIRPMGGNRELEGSSASPPHMPKFAQLAETLSIIQRRRAHFGVKFITLCTPIASPWASNSLSQKFSAWTGVKFKFGATST